MPLLVFGRFSEGEMLNRGSVSDIGCGVSVSVRVSVWV